MPKPEPRRHARLFETLRQESAATSPKPVAKREKVAPLTVEQADMLRSLALQSLQPRT